MTPLDDAVQIEQLDDDGALAFTNEVSRTAKAEEAHWGFFVQSLKSQSVKISECGALAEVNRWLENLTWMLRDVKSLRGR